MKLIFGIISAALSFSITEKADDKEVFEDLIQPRGDCCKCLLVLHTDKWTDCQIICNALNNCAAWTWKSDKTCLTYTSHTAFFVDSSAYGGIKGDFVMPGYQATGNYMMQCWLRSLNYNKILYPNSRISILWGPWISDDNIRWLMIRSHNLYELIVWILG